VMTRFLQPFGLLPLLPTIAVSADAMSNRTIERFAATVILAAVLTAAVRDENNVPERVARINCSALFP